MLRLRDVHQVSERAPSEWRGLDHKGVPVRICYQDGALTVTHGDNPDRCEVVCYRRLGPSGDDYVTYAEVYLALIGLVDLP
jgi:hypothetical protein